MIQNAMPAGQRWLFDLLLWRTALRQAEAFNLEWRDLPFAGAQPSATVRNIDGIPSFFTVRSLPVGDIMLTDRLKNRSSG